MSRDALMDLPDMALFRSVVEAGGVSAAAHALRSSPPAISRRLAALESRLGVRLADRSSRRFRITDEGELLYARCCTILDQVRDAEAEVASRGGIARGSLRVGAPSEFGRRHIAPMIVRFVADHPDLRVHFVLSDAGLEVGEDGFDVVLRIGMPDEEGLLAHKLATSPCRIVAAPSYLERRGPVGSIAALADHDCLILARRKRLVNVWRFLEAGKEVGVEVRGRITSGSGEALHALARAGAGISLEAMWDVKEDLSAGMLVDALPNTTPSPIDLYATFASGKPIAPRVRLFVDFLATHLSSKISSTAGIAPINA